jgi:hypothetical protein
LVGWLVGWLVGRLVGWLVGGWDWFVGWLVGWLVGWGWLVGFVVDMDRGFRRIIPIRSFGHSGSSHFGSGFVAERALHFALRCGRNNGSGPPAHPKPI